MMELTDFEQPLGSCTRSSFFIDLNEAPSSSASSPRALLDYDIRQLAETYATNCFMRDMAVSSELCALACAVCGQPEVRGDVLVCDGCERGFHLYCAGFKGIDEPPEINDWICLNCSKDGALSKRWPLGVKRRRILDINSSPPRELESDSSSQTDRSLGTDHLKQDYIGYKHPSHNMLPVHPADADNVVVHRNLNDSESSLHRRTGRDEAARMEIMYNLSNVFLENLKKFVYERNGILENGWSVKFKCSSVGNENSVTYCSPDGPSFESMPEVASFLGLCENPVNLNEKKEGICRRPAPRKLPKKRKIMENVVVNGHSESNKISVNKFQKVHLSNDPIMTGRNSIDNVVVDVEDDVVAKDYDVEPVQFEDYYILSLGLVDCRSSYHCTDAIWPVGFKSMWHDKVTRSIFVSEILDGGSCGPLFTVKRFPCSALLIPRVRTAILPSKKFLGNRSLVQHVESEGEEIVEAIIKRESSPTEIDIISCLRDNAFRNSTSLSCNLKDLADGSTGYSHYSSCHTSLKDKIGEIYVEERSTSSAWKLMAQKLVCAYTEFGQMEQQLNIFSNHADGNFPNWVNKSGTSDAICDSLLKFSSSPSLFRSSVYNGEYESLSSDLMKWLSVDRFGLDVEFVQEILEQFLEVDSCSTYQHLSKRCQAFEAYTVSNHRLIAKCCFLHTGESYREKPRLLRDSVARYHGPPSDSNLLSRLPKKLAGDLYTVWKVLSHLHKVLGIEEPIPLKQLEQEILAFEYDGLTAGNNTKINSSKIGINLLGKQLVERASSSFISPSEHDKHFHTESGIDNASTGNKVPSLNYASFLGELLTKVHCAVLHILVCELLSKVVACLNPSFDILDSKSTKARKRDTNCSVVEHKRRLNLLPLNELTWPELSRRFILTFVAMDGALESSDVIGRESSRVYCCLGGDGGQLCGSIPKAAGMEADALFLAEATKQIYASMSRKNIVIAEEQLNTSYADCGNENRKDCEHGTIPEWAQVLEPVRKLPTNVGTRIRKCVQDALEKCPPEWAKKRLEHSISKEVYKGNASGPTKKAVLAVLSEVHNEDPQPRTETVKNNIIVHVDDIIMNQCRSVMRRAAAIDDDKKFCTLLGRIIVSPGEHTDGELLGVPAVVPRPLDFRAIDYRLSAGAYCGFHESFHEDVLELLSNVQSAFRDHPEILEVAHKVFERFEYLFETEVLPLVHKLQEYTMLDTFTKDIRNDIKNIVDISNNIPKAPWDDGLCKVCGIDRDDNSVLLCDSCDAEYHTYCLDPPLEKIPEGNWYCPACTHEQMPSESVKYEKDTHKHTHQKSLGELTLSHLYNLSCLASSMEEKDYWDLGSNEKITLLKFLTDELLNSTMIRQHLEQCAEISSGLQQKLRTFSNEWKNLRSRMEHLSARNQKNDDAAIGSQVLSSINGHDGDVFNGNCKEMLVEERENGVSLQNGTATISACGRDNDLAPAKDHLCQLQSSMKKLELELYNISLKREFLGCDCKGNLYWASVTPDNHPFIIVNYSPPMLVKNVVNLSRACGFTDGQHSVVSEGSRACFSLRGDDKDVFSIGSWDFFRTDAEVEQLVCCLREDVMQEKILKKTILQCWQSRKKYRPDDINSHCKDFIDDLTVSIKNENWHNLTTRAMSFIEKKFGKLGPIDVCSIMNIEAKCGAKQEEKAYRCDCLEPIWPSRYHCQSCHRTFGKSLDLQKHSNGNCQIAETVAVVDDAGEDYSTGVNLVSFSKAKEFGDGIDGPPFDFEFISTKFTTQDSIKDLVQSIGLIDSQGIAALLSSFYPVNGSTILLNSSSNDANEHAVIAENSDKAISITDTQNGLSCSYHPQKNATDPGYSKDSNPLLECLKDYRYTSAQSSLLPVSRKASKVFSLLKINLLDMEAALCEDGYRPSRAEPEKRWAWRSFVKSAVSIYQMVQATVLFEEMINCQFLSCEWWHWSSLSAAAKTSTISSLALRIYSLDAAILYEKCSCDQKKTFASSKKCNVSKKYSRKNIIEG